MALKYGSKSGGFGLRSGKGVPFKSMGSSPAKDNLSKLAQGTQERVDEYKKRDWEQDHTTTKHKDYKEPETKISKIAPLGVESLNVKVGDKPIEATKTFKETSAEIKAEEEAKPKKHKAQIRKQKRLNNITDRRNRKGKKGLTSRQIRLQGEVDKTAEQFVSDRKAKLQKAGDFAIQIGRQISGDSKGITTSLEDSTANRLNEAANAKKIALQKTVDNKEAVLPKDNKLATKGNSGEETANLESAKITSTDNSSTRAVQRQKDLDKQIADDKAKMEKELGINQV